MTPCPRLRPRSRAALIALRAAVLVTALALLLGACAAPAASFDPTGACTGDGSAAGAYPDLEALIPTQYHGAAPERLDSGRELHGGEPRVTRLGGDLGGPLRRRHVDLR